MANSDNHPEQPKASLTDRLLIVETELRSLRSGLGAIGGIAAMVFGLLGIALAWNVSSERKDLRDFRNELKDELRVALGQTANEPEIVLRTDDDKPLDGAAIEPIFTLEPDGKLKKMTVRINIRNQGKGWSGKDVAIKIYTPKEIPSRMKSTDEPNFSFQDYWIGADDTGLTSMPSGFSYGYNLNIYVESTKTIPAGRYRCLVKFYYGRAKLTVANITLLVKAAA